MSTRQFFHWNNWAEKPHPNVGGTILWSGVLVWIEVKLNTRRHLSASWLRVQWDQLQAPPPWLPHHHWTLKLWAQISPSVGCFFSDILSQQWVTKAVTSIIRKQLGWSEVRAGKGCFLRRTARRAEAEGAAETWHTTHTLTTVTEDGKVSIGSVESWQTTPNRLQFWPDQPQTLY